MCNAVLNLYKITLGQGTNKRSFLLTEAENVTEADYVAESEFRIVREAQDKVRFHSCSLNVIFVLYLLVTLLVLSI